MTLGEYINNYINEHNMSIREFAKAADISHSYISYIINGKTPRGTAPALTIDKYQKIANAMNLSTNELLASVETGIVWGEQPQPREQIRDELRILYDAAEDAPASAILEAAALIMRRKEQNQ